MIDLKNSTSVKNYLNQKLNDVWDEFLWLRFAPPYDIIRCVSISVPTVKLEKIDEQKQFIGMNLIFEHSKFSRLLLEFKGKGQSKINHDPGRSSRFRVYCICIAMKIDFLWNKKMKCRRKKI